MMKCPIAICFCAISLLTALLLPLSGMAGGTRLWEVAGSTEFEHGETDGTVISSIGEVSLGYAARKLDFPEAGLAWCAVKGPKGNIYVGTGYDGRIYRIRNGLVADIASTGQLVVTSLIVDKTGDLYAATLPDPIIWKIPNPDKIRGNKPVQAAQWTTLPQGTAHVWTLALSRDGRHLYAGTGPQGKVFAIGMDKKPHLFLDTEEEHILALTPHSTRGILAGTSPNAKLFRILGPGRSRALADFDATEVKAIAVHKDTIFTAVNKFKTPPAVPTQSKNTSNSQASTGTKTTKKKSTRDAGDGALYWMKKSQQPEKLWQEKKAHVVSIAVSKEGELFAGLGAEGKVIAIDAKRTVRTVLDLDERQVMGLIAGDDLNFAATGDAGAVYQVLRARKKEALYYSPVLDAKGASRWGRLSWYARGKLTAQSRSGNTKEPDDSWTDWSQPIPFGKAPPSPTARYLQLRFSWALDATAHLVSTELAYRPENQRAVITRFDPGSPFPETKKSKKGDKAKLSTRTVPSKPAQKNETELDFTWVVSNPDGDTLRYQLWYRAVDATQWRPITKPDEVLTAKRFTWLTESVPEGRYQVRLLADDSPDNDLREVKSDAFISVPVLVDNHQPRVEGLAFTKGRVRGVARDSFSAISHLEVSVDGAPWMPIFSKDGIFDTPVEVFEFSLPKDIASGPHAVGVRAYDRTGNMGTAEIHIDVTDR